MYKVIFGIYGISLTILIAASVSSCSANKETQKAEVAYRPVASLQELMVSVIDPNVDPIWNAVSTESTKDGFVEKVPQTDEEWTVLRHHALTLIEAANLLAIDGRAVAQANATTSTHAVELKPVEIQKLIDEKGGDFVNNAYALQDAAKLALVAIDNKNSDELLRVGGLIERACEQCHSQFWYPSEKVPTANLDIGLQSGSVLYLKMRKLS